MVRPLWRGQPLTVYVLFEHKSRPEHWTQLQLLRYQAAEGDAFIERYIEQGKQLGLERGRQEGRLEGEAAILLRQIDRKFGTPSEAVQERIASADQDTLLRWSERILTAENIDALLH